VLKELQLQEEDAYIPATLAVATALRAIIENEATWDFDVRIGAHIALETAFAMAKMVPMSRAKFHELTSAPDQGMGD
jgi:hypothetical protein